MPAVRKNVPPFSSAAMSTVGSRLWASTKSTLSIFRRFRLQSNSLRSFSQSCKPNSVELSPLDLKPDGDLAARYDLLGYSEEKGDLESAVGRLARNRSDKFPLLERGRGRRLWLKFRNSPVVPLMDQHKRRLSPTLRKPSHSGSKRLRSLPIRSRSPKAAA